jgi:hypothetical protein
MFCFGFFLGALMDRTGEAIFNRVEMWLDRRSAAARHKEYVAKAKFEMAFHKGLDRQGITLVPPAKRIDGLAKAGLDDFRKDFDAKASVPPPASKE